jgi:hypothetical protein
MQILELPMRKDGLIPKEHLEEINAAKLVADESFDIDQYMTDNDLYGYNDVTFSVANVDTFHAFDEKHTHVILSTGLSFIAKIEYKKFQHIYTALTGYNVKSVDDFKFE